MASFRDRSVLITGASSGIGAELAREVVRRGGRVGLLARRRERLEELAQEIRHDVAGGDGDAAAWATADVTDGDELDAALDRLAEELGGVDVVVANAGYGRPEAPYKFRPGRSLHMYDTNLNGMLRLFDWALPRFLSRGEGQLVGVASLASFLGLPNTASYCGSKAAMRVHLQSLRVSLAPYGIAVTTICPGFVESELTEKNKHSMPFLWPTERAVRRIADSIEKEKGEDLFPWQMATMIRFLHNLVPTPVAEFFLRRAAPEPKPYEGPPPEES